LRTVEDRQALGQRAFPLGHRTMVALSRCIALRT
jgi:hypothetical protein